MPPWAFRSVRSGRIEWASRFAQTKVKNSIWFVVSTHSSISVPIRLIVGCVNRVGTTSSHHPLFLLLICWTDFCLVETDPLIQLANLKILPKS